MVIIQWIAAAIVARLLLHKWGTSRLLHVAMASIAVWMLTPGCIHYIYGSINLGTTWHATGAVAILAAVVLLGGYLRYRSQRAAVEKHFSPKNQNVSLKRRVGRSP